MRTRKKEDEKRKKEAEENDFGECGAVNRNLAQEIKSLREKVGQYNKERRVLVPASHWDGFNYPPRLRMLLPLPVLLPVLLFTCITCL